MSYANNPDAVLDYCVDFNPENLTSNIIEVIRRIVDEDLSQTNFEVKHLSGGNTNILYHICSDDKKHQYIVRLYGVGTEDFIDRRVENVIFSELSKSGISPSFIGQFKNGRVEGYLNARPLIPDEFALIPISRSIARSMANLQGISIDIEKSVGLWKKMHVFFSLAQENIEANRLPTLSSYYIPLTEMTQEALWLENTLETLRHQLTREIHSTLDDYMRGRLFGFETVLCHNDVLSGNVLLHDQSPSLPSNSAESNPQITLIDYEYSCYNYRAFDIANHFCEYAGFEFDIRNKFPSKVHRKEFITHFILQTNTLNHQIQDPYPLSEEFLDGVDDIVMKFALASHLAWGSWAVIQAAHSLIDFDFLEYATTDDVQSRCLNVGNQPMMLPRTRTCSFPFSIINSSFMTNLPEFDILTRLGDSIEKRFHLVSLVQVNTYRMID